MQLPKWLQIGICFVLMAIASVLTKNILASYKDEKQFVPSRDTQSALYLLKVEMDKRIPLKADDVTTLVGFDVGPQQVHYRYHVGLPYSDGLAYRFRTTLRPQLLNAYCTEQDLAIFRSLNVKAKYSYKTEDNRGLVDIIVAQSECQ